MKHWGPEGSVSVYSGVRGKKQEWGNQEWRKEGRKEDLKWRKERKSIPPHNTLLRISSHLCLEEHWLL